MNETWALNLIKSTFENPFDRERFLIFAKNLFHFLDTDTFIYRGNLIPDAYDSHIKTLERLGKYEDVDGHKIEVLAVCLNKQSALERARTMQRNFIAWYLNGSRGGIAKDAALVAFYTKDSDDWRLSLVKMDYHLGESKAGKIKAITELTPARRFSFLVGANENTHTAQRQLLPILKDTDFKPALSDLESAFSVEVVTKDFFEKYKKLFLDTKEALDAMVAKDAKIKSDFQEKNIDTTDFAKKLLGQIVFLYFLQKKGWFGVARDAVWGTGPKDFLRRLFEKTIAPYDNFFNDTLEPLFYEALAVERTDDFYSKFNCKIPFLNGGLFDPLGNYDWVHTDIRLPDELFSNNRKTKEGDTGDGILDVFDRYNFTVKEDEPLEREVAVDPEMLGKVFENLLEVKDRKSKGTYYTPREIVHYMCQESLINYLLTELDGKVRRDDIETLIRLGETAIEHEARVINEGRETKDYHFRLPQSIRDNAHLLDEKLEKIHVCDPAVGSGAFLVGMMTEVIRVRNILTNYLSDNGRSIYDFKRHAIQNCLYGVDIDPGAVEIAKLRLWLSLIVDEQDIKQIKPLPNLDYKIMQGNSLLEEYEGIKLFESEAKLEQQHFFDLISEAERITKQLQELKAQFFKTAHKTEKDEIKREIENLTWDLIEASVKEQKKLSLLPEIERFKKANIKPFFLWKLNFSEVFEKNGGFDVVIANPPYFQLQKNKKVSQELSKLDFKTYSKSSDVYCVFYEKGVNLLKNMGTLSYISSNSWMKTKYGALLRKYFKENTNPLILIDFENSQVFDTAIVESNVIVLEKSVFQNKLRALSFNLTSNRYVDISSYFSNNYVTLDNLDDNGWIISNLETASLRAKLEKDSTPLKQLNQRIYIGILNGYNDAFVISTETKNKLTKVDPKSAEIIKPMLRGRDVGKYYYEWQDLWLINSHNGIKGKLPRIDVAKNYPAIYKHLAQYRDKLEIRHNKGSHWTNLRNCVYFEEFEKPKIIWGELSDKPKFTYDDKGFIAEATLFAMVGDNLKYLLGILNSKLGLWYFEQISTSSGMGTSRWKKYKIELFPIKNTNKINIEKIVSMVNKILVITTDRDYLRNSIKQSQVIEYEKQIDQLVYKLYGLTTEEIAVVESS
ncbi:BREX-1 system adenine-specific DNA-methyltransferase PglX [Patescibacteria group bacterium]|nr:BREX-1 system adenine-specific DNA-methyltransferase PglX [Patescibacteria group bacterium]